MFLWRLSFCARDRRHPVAEGGWKEVVEEALLPSQGLRNLLCPQRQSQGTKNKMKMLDTAEPFKNWIYTDYFRHFLFEHIRHCTCFYLTRDLLCICALFQRHPPKSFSDCGLFYDTDVSSEMSGTNFCLFVQGYSVNRNTQC